MPADHRDEKRLVSDASNVSAPADRTGVLEHGGRRPDLTVWHRQRRQHLVICRPAHPVPADVSEREWRRVRNG